MGPRCVIDLLIFLGESGEEFLGTLCLLAGATACKIFLGFDKPSKRDMETALPGLLSIRVPGVLDRERPEPGEAEANVMVGIKSVLRR